MTYERQAPPPVITSRTHVRIVYRAFYARKAGPVSLDCVSLNQLSWSEMRVRLAFCARVVTRMWSYRWMA